MKKLATILVIILTLSLAYPFAMADIYDSGLDGWWTMDSTRVVDNVTDSSTNANNGFMNGFTSTSSALASGQIAQGLLFDGSNDYILLGNPASLDISGATTICYWVNPTSLVSAAGDFNSVYTSLSAVGITQATFLYNETGTIYFVWSADGVSFGSIQSFAGGVVINRWTHICGVRNTSDGATGVIYKNGVASTTAVSQSALVATVGFNPITIGGDLNGYDSPPTGRLDDVRVYNRALAANEVAQLYLSSLNNYSSDY